MTVGTLPTMAGNYPYLTFELTDGTKVSVSVTSLTLSVNGTTLKAGSQTFIISNLSKMYFSTTDESTTGIESISIETLDEATDIYDLSGKKIVNSKSSNSKLPRGVYIVKTKSKTYKIVVR